MWSTSTLGTTTYRERDHGRIHRGAFCSPGQIGLFFKAQAVFRFEREKPWESIRRAGFRRPMDSEIQRLQARSGGTRRASHHSVIEVTAKSKAVGTGSGCTIRTHLLLRGNGIYGPLADFVVSPWFDKQNATRQQFSYCGEQELRGPSLHRASLRGCSGLLRMTQSTAWRILAGCRPQLHSAQGRMVQPERRSRTRIREIDICSDFREAAPGVWYPWHAQATGDQQSHHDARAGERSTGAGTCRSKRSVSHPNTRKRLFRELVVPKGTKVDVDGQAEQAGSEVLCRRKRAISRRTQTP